ncbi:MAG: efflux RND transporter periplasmic adaptor subunit [Verrucomicrobia bacterium]|nr:efflux RND transporter periplasmic adaptor subunit [Verrucomicrobiota bacterium]
MSSPLPDLDALRIDRSQEPPRGRRGWWWVVAALLLLGGCGWWFTRPGPVQVETAQVRSLRADGGGGRTLLNASGYVTTRLEATVSSKITGKVSEILIEEGMKVEKDQVVAKLDASNVEAGLRLAEAQLKAANLMLAEIEPLAEYADTELNRLRGLDRSGSVSRSELGKAEADARIMQAKIIRQRADIAVAERQVDEWKQQLEDTVIRAPFAGVVTTKDSQPGEMISPMSAGGGFTRTGICTLVDMGSLEIEVDVNESFINRVKPGQTVEATLDAYPDWKIPCKVAAIIPTADRQKATVKVRVAFSALDPRILPQMGVKVAFQSDESAAPAGRREILTIPKSAVRESGGRHIAWVVRDGKTERRAITLDPSPGDDRTVLAGLAAGETVVVNPPSDLTDGAAVTPKSSR